MHFSWEFQTSPFCSFPSRREMIFLRLQSLSCFRCSSIVVYEGLHTLFWRRWKGFRLRVRIYFTIKFKRIFFLFVMKVGKMCLCWLLRVSFACRFGLSVVEVVLANFGEIWFFRRMAFKCKKFITVLRDFWCPYSSVSIGIEHALTEKFRPFFD